MIVIFILLFIDFGFELNANGFGLGRSLGLVNEISHLTKSLQRNRNLSIWQNAQILASRC
jgi:hypothetical protein